MTSDAEFPMAPMTEPCEECRFGPSSVEDIAAEIGVLGRKFAAPMSKFLAGEDGVALVRTRPGPDTWSPLEYACHVRDVLRVFHGRTHEMVSSPGVQFTIWDHDAAVIDDGYNESDSATVAQELHEQALAYAATLQGLSDADRQATGIRAPGEVFTVDSLALYALHEARHHLLDIGRGLRAARGR